MTDYIKREGALDIVAHNNVHGEITLNRYDKIIDGIYEIPSEDVAPVRHGHWFQDAIYYGEDGSPCIVDICTECGAYGYYADFNYCPNCGAKMDGESDE